MLDSVVENVKISESDEYLETTAASAVVSAIFPQTVLRETLLIPESNFKVDGRF